MLMDSNKAAFFDIKSIKIDNVAGRYFFHLAREFIEAGYQPVYRDRFKFVATFKTARYRGFLLDLPFRLYRGQVNSFEGYESTIFITDSKREYEKCTLKHKVLISYEHRRAATGEVPLTFGIGPGLYREVGRDQRSVADSPRDMKVFFAGNVAKGYSRDLLKHDYGMLNRVEVLRIVKQHFSSKIEAPESADDAKTPCQWRKDPSYLFLQKKDKFIQVCG
jgi:hypothetical protein